LIIHSSLFITFEPQFRSNSEDDFTEKWDKLGLMKKSLLIILLVLFLVPSCAKYVHTPIIDSRGSHLKGADLKRYHDDLFTCQEIAANQDVNKKKTRIFTERCMEGRGYVDLDKGM